VSYNTKGDNYCKMIRVSNFAIDTGDENRAQKNNRVPKLVCSHKLVLRGISGPVFDCCSFSS
jgi:hypothetical protein